MIVAGLAVTIVRHDLQIPHTAWEWYGQFFVSWFIHTMGVAVLCAISAGAIIMSHKFFLGYEFDDKDPLRAFDDKSHQLAVYILITVVVASVCVLMIAHYVPINDD